MIRTISDFTSIWKDESEITARVLAALTDVSLAQKETARDRSLGDMAWHIATAIPEMMGHAGMAIAGADHNAPTPTSARAIHDAYLQAAAALREKTGNEWTDETLAVEDEMYGERWPRGMTLLVLLIHQIHHRGAMTVLMRQAGLVVPSIYGPNREETETMHRS